MPVTLPNTYTSPQDVYDLIGIDSAQLHLDDQNQASGQQVSTTAAAAIGATSITVAALQYAMLLGTRLVFSDAGMTTPVEVTLTAVAAVGATTLTVTALTVAVPSGSVAIDNGVNVWLAGLLVKACRIGTAKVKLYCCGRYNDSDLVNSWSVNQWATAIAAKWLGTRLYRAAPKQAEDAAAEAIAEMKEVQAGNLNIEDIGTRTSGWPFLSNVTIDDGYTYRKIRVDPQTSEPTVTQYPQAVNYNSALMLEW